MLDRRLIANDLAVALVASRWDEAALIERCRVVIGGSPRWVEPFVRRQLAAFPRPPRPSAAALADVILEDIDFRRARLPVNLGKHPRIFPPPEMDLRSPVLRQIPCLCTAKDLADWLGISLPQLDSFADLKGMPRHHCNSKWMHYDYRIVAKRFGAVRLIESPKPRLKLLQRKIQREILDAIPPHEAAHGFRAGRSIASFVAPHVGHAIVARIDLCDIFPSITRERVAGFFRTIGYPESVARSLAGISTSIAPTSLWDGLHGKVAIHTKLVAQSRYAIPHLPQGAPTSPAIANLCAYRLDCRLAGLARVAGGQYSRYADDLAFSGDETFARHIGRFLVHVTATVAEEGFSVQHRKTRVMRDGVRQSLVGLVINRKPNVRRTDYDRLKAILVVNCRTHGLESQNRSGYSDFLAHLNGHVAFVEQINPARGRRLREMYNAISGK